MAVFRPVQRSTEVVQQIQQMIVGQQLKPGDGLGTLKELCQQFGVSLPTMRNAIYLLQQDGSVVVRTGQLGGVFVSSPEAQPMARGLQQILSYDRVSKEDLQELRMLIETEATRLAALRATDEELKNLQASVADMASLVGRSQSAFLDENLRFHDMIAMATHNMILYRMYQSVESLLYQSTVTWYPVEVQQEVVQAHRQITEALVAKNPEKAQERARRHLLAFDQYLRVRASPHRP